jgi:hypothetical protein
MGFENSFSMCCLQTIDERGCIGSRSQEHFQMIKLEKLWEKVNDPLYFFLNIVCLCALDLDGIHNGLSYDLSLIVIRSMRGVTYSYMIFSTIPFVIKGDNHIFYNPNWFKWNLI